MPRMQAGLPPGLAKDHALSAMGAAAMPWLISSITPLRKRRRTQQNRTGHQILPAGMPGRNARPVMPPVPAPARTGKGAGNRKIPA